MNAAFVLSGLILLAGVAGSFQTVRPSGRRPAGRVSAALLALSPLGLVVAGSFTLEAVMPHLLGFLLATGTPVASFLDHRTVPARHPRLAAVWHLAAASQSTDAGAAGRLLPHLRPGCGRRQRGGWRALSSACWPSRSSPGSWPWAGWPTAAPSRRRTSPPAVLLRGGQQGVRRIGALTAKSSLPRPASPTSRCPAEQTGGEQDDQPKPAMIMARCRRPPEALGSTPAWSSPVTCTVRAAPAVAQPDW